MKAKVGRPAMKFQDKKTTVIFYVPQKHVKAFKIKALEELQKIVSK